MRLSVLFMTAGLIILTGIASGCRNTPTDPTVDILGRWEVVQQEAISVPNSFFWFSMDYVEFRVDGTVWGLIAWPPGSESDDLRLNKTAQYTLTADSQIEFVGSCRHQDPCTGVYTLALTADALQIFDTNGTLNLKRVALPGKSVPPTVIGPAPSATPAASSQTTPLPSTHYRRI